MSENIFADEWMECLEAHYTHVIRTQDRVTEPSLTIVMHSAGFTDKQLAELRVRATMHVDDVGADFVPDLSVLDGHDHNHHEAPAHTHDSARLETPEPPIFNIPIDLPPAAAETVVSEIEVLSVDEVSADVQQAVFEVDGDIPEVELAVAMVDVEFEAEVDIPEAELEILADMPEVEAEDVEVESLVEAEPEELDPDAPQQLSLF